MKLDISKQQEAVLTRALTEGGTCRSTTAYAALVCLGPVTVSEAESLLSKAISVLKSLAELGLMVNSSPGEYHLTQNGSRVAEDLEQDNGATSILLKAQ